MKISLFFSFILFSPIFCQHTITNNFTDLVLPLGYPVEIHNITTQDGYFLPLFRIPGPKNSVPPFEKKPPVLLEAGVLCDADFWVFEEE